jgi:excisionase family DNA binding protein
MSSSGLETTPALITKKDAARLLGVSRDTIHRLVRDGVLQDVRIHERMIPRLRRDDVLALARAKERPDE